MANSHRLFCVFFWLSIRFSIQIKKTCKNFCEIPRQTARNFPIIVRGKKLLRNTPAKRLKLSNISREIICLSWTCKNKNGEKNKMKEAEKWSWIQVENVFLTNLSVDNIDKNFGSKCEAKQVAYEQSVAHYTLLRKIVGSARLWIH